MRVREVVPFVVVVGVVLLACKSGEQANANVACKGTSETIDCDVTHKAGSKALNVCWDLKFTCRNAQVVTGDNFCQSVQPGAMAQKRIPISELKNYDQCDKAVSTEVTNMKLSAL